MGWHKTRIYNGAEIHLQLKAEIVENLISLPALQTVTDKCRLLLLKNQDDALLGQENAF